MRQLYYLILTFLTVITTRDHVFSQLSIEIDSTIRNASNFKELRVDPAIVDGDSINVLLDSINYVFLETTKQSELSWISQLGVTQNEYIIFDKNLDAIFIFDKSGRFKKKLASPNDFKNAAGGFSINQNEFAIYIEDFHDLLIHKFDFNGKKIGQINKIDHVGQFDFQEHYKINYYSFDSSIISPDSQYLANLSIRDLNTDKSVNHLWFNSYNNRSLGFYANRSLYASNGHLLFARELDPVIYGFEKGQIFRKWKIFFPLEYSLPLDFLYNPIYKGKYIDYLTKHLGVFHKLNNVYETSNFLTFSFKSGKTYIYDKLSDITYDLAYLGKTNFRNIKLLNDSGLNILAVDQECFITDLHSSNIKRRIKELKESEKKDLDKKLLELSKEKYFNPVLVLLFLNKSKL